MKALVQRTAWAAGVFVLTFQSFACLLSEFYGLVSMRWLALLTYLPAAVILTGIALRGIRLPRSMDNPATWILHGAIGGLIAAVVYDVYRLPFVLAGAPLFVVFPRFGQMLIGAEASAGLIHAAGWAYHFSNGAALGVMYLALAALVRCRRLMLGAVIWAMGVEVILLLTPYADFFGLKMNTRFIFLTASAHAVFGLVLGWYCRTVLSPAMSENLPSKRDSQHATQSLER